MRDLAGDLSGAAEARQYVIDNPGASPEHEGLFSTWVAPAACRNADTLTLLAEDQDEPGADLPEPRRLGPDASPWFTRTDGGTAHQSRGRSL